MCASDSDETIHGLELIPAAHRGFGFIEAVAYERGGPGGLLDIGLLAPGPRTGYDQ